MTYSADLITLTVEIRHDLAELPDRFERETTIPAWSTVEVALRIYLKREEASWRQALTDPAYQDIIMRGLRLSSPTSELPPGRGVPIEDQIIAPRVPRQKRKAATSKRAGRRTERTR